ncbi:MAG: ABC transporter substrate-binding protein [Methanomicrobiaceae archaeon]|nr:ABC transporter substrate-binding protein [Methanomicrobiaceae archaeon]
MKIRAKLSLIIIILIAAFTAGCTDTSLQTAEESFITITDDTGIKVTIQKYPQRIISLAPSETEIFCALNTGDAGISLVGRNDYDDYPEEILSVPSVGGPQTLSIESIVSKDPNLIIATTVSDKTTIEQLRNLGYPVLIFKLNTFEDVYRNIETLGNALGLEKAAEDLVFGMKADVFEIQGMLIENENPKVMYVVSASPLYVAGNNTLQNDMIILAGGENIFSDLDGYFVTSEEAIINREPDVIILPSGHGSMDVDFKGQFLSKTELNCVSAVKNNRVYTVDANVVSRPGPRITQGLELFYRCINGETQ